MGISTRSVPQHWLAAFLFLFLITAGHAQNIKPVPELKAHVTDEINLLSPSQRQSLENYLTDYENRTGSQIAVLLIDNTAPETIEQYSIRVTDEWKLGRKGIDDGVLLVVAKNNPSGLRRLRIEAGRGVQGVLTDMRSKQILQDIIAPYFRQNDFYNGLTAGVTAITSTLDKETFPDNTNGNHEESTASWSPFLILILFFIFIIIRSSFSRRFGKHGHWGASGIILGGGLHDRFRDHDDFGTGGFSGGGFGGGGGGFDGGGASGDW